MRLFRLISIAILLAGCARTASTLAISVPAPSPTPGATAQVTETPTRAPTTIPETLSTPQAASPTQSVGGTLSSQVLQTLLDFPLSSGNSWVYQYEGYSEQEKAVWKVADSVVQDEIHPALNVPTLLVFSPPVQQIQNGIAGLHVVVVVRRRVDVAAPPLAGNL